MDTYTLRQVATFVKAYHKQQGKGPTDRTIGQRLKLPDPELNQALQALIQQGAVRMEEGRVTPTRQAVKEEKREQRAKAPPKRIRFDVGPALIQVVMASVSVVAVAISIYFSRVWLARFLDPVRSFALATIMVIYGTVAPQVTLFLYHGRGVMRKVAGALVALTATLVILFSMTSTVAGQFEGLTLSQEVQVEQTLEQVTRARQWDIIQEQKAELQQVIEQKQEEVSTLQRTLAEFSTFERRTEGGGAYYVTTRRDLTRANQELSVLRDELASVREVESEYLASGEEGFIEETRVEQRNFFQWVAAIIGGDPDALQFLLSILPAVFIDIIAPLALAVALFLTKKPSQDGRA